MKLKYEIFQSTNYPQTVLIDRIVSFLKLDYEILSTSDNCVTFKSGWWAFGLKSKQYRKIDGGKFEIITSGNQVGVKFTYYKEILPDTVLLTVLILLSLIIDFHILFFGAGFLLIMLISIVTLKTITKELLVNITG
jgi:hypothetical protein